MSHFLAGNPLEEKFKKYLVDVIEYYTPQIIRYAKGLPSNWNETLFGSDLRNGYGFFMSSILNIHMVWNRGITGNGYEVIHCLHKEDPKVRYSIITLNYDMVPESFAGFINDTMSIPEGPFEFEYPIPGIGNLYPSTEYITPYLAKLHGSVHDKSIVPPTWNKGGNTSIVCAWNKASELLRDATHIRILGYSLPVADTYVKYLLKSAVAGESFLKQIDIICSDHNGSVKARYDDFVGFVNYRFVDARVQEYLHLHWRKYGDPSRMDPKLGLTFEKLEEVHQEFMNSHSATTFK